MIQWTNYFVTSLRASTTEGHLPSDQLRDKLLKHDGSEAYHCAYDLEARHDFKDYQGLMRPALGYVWFDFDSHDGGEAALKDVQSFVKWLELSDVFICYSGSKGFHVGVPFSYFGLEPSTDLGNRLRDLAHVLRRDFKTLDTTIYNASRKFRALGSRHPKTGLYKTAVHWGDLDLGLAHIKQVSKLHRTPIIRIPELRSPLNKLTDLLTPPKEVTPEPPKKEKVYNAPSGEAAFKQCGFLQHVREDQEKVSEPKWYAALSIVSRFSDGRKQCHVLSYKHKDYSVASCNSKIDQALKESAPRTCENIATLWDGCARCPLYGKITSPVNIFDRRFWSVTEKGSLQPEYNLLLDHFKKELPYKTIADMKAVYVFKETHYVEFTPIEIKAYAEEKFEPKPQEKHRQEFAHKVFANSIERRTFFIETTRDQINFKNGILSLFRSKENGSDLLPHSPSVGFRGVLPYNFKRDESCPTFDWWINDVMCGDEELIAILQEYMGYVIRGGEYKYHKALWLSGSGRNGKSTFLSVLKALIGTGNYSTLSIRQIINDKFSSADLDGKIANFSEETSPEELSDSGPFKNLTGDGELLAQKKYGDPYSFRNRAKLIMTYNEVPELRDLSPGMLSRPIIIPWKKDLTLEESQDKNLKEKLLAELPGIFNWALAGWERLEAQEQFSKSPKSQLELDRVQSASCSALQWLSNYVQFLPIDSNSSTRAVLSPMDLYESYRATERTYAYKAVKFFRRINEHPDMKLRWRHTRNGNEYFSMLLRQNSSFSESVKDPKVNLHHASQSFTVEY